MSNFKNHIQSLKLLTNILFKSFYKKFLILLIIAVYSKLVFSSNFDREMSLKTGFIYNFARLGEWESAFDHKDKFTICSPDAIFIEVAKTTFKNKKVNKLIVTVNQIDTGSDLTTCNMVFITKKYYRVWKNKVDYSELEQVMLVGENKGFIKSGGHVNFFILAGKIRFEVSVDNLIKSKLKLSSKVLRLGKIHGGVHE